LVAAIEITVSGRIPHDPTVGSKTYFVINKKHPADQHQAEHHLRGLKRGAVRIVLEKAADGAFRRIAAGTVSASPHISLLLLTEVDTQCARHIHKPSLPNPG
jgi:hypothetical protein